MTTPSENAPAALDAGEENPDDLVGEEVAAEHDLDVAAFADDDGE